LQIVVVVVDVDGHGIVDVVPTLVVALIIGQDA
jgi:hypothetical protein